MDILDSTEDRTEGELPPGPRLPPPDTWLRRPWATALSLVVFSALITLAWSNSLGRDVPAVSLAGDDTPSVVAGEPSPSMLAAIEVVTSTETTGATGPAGSSGDASPSAPAGATAATAPTAPASTPATSTAPSYTAPSSTAPSPAPGGAVPSTAGQPAEPPVPQPPDRPTRVFPVNTSPRLSTAQLVELVETNGITNVADFLSALPPYMGESFTLMEESRSRHRASTEYPRLIMYGPDARMLIGVSSHPLDPLREVVELAELDDVTGLWRFSQLDFRSTFLHDTDTQSCAGCHGSPQRPIWGEYPDWPGAFAGQDERLTGGQVASLMNLKRDPIDRFHHLVFPSDHSIQNNGQLYLSTREYGYANTSFNFELNAAVADGLARRIIGHPNWGAEGHRLLAMQWRCDGRYDPVARDALYNRFGIDGNNDFQLESPAFEATAGQRDEYDWNQGSTGLDDSVAFRTLDLAAQQDPALDAIVSADQLFVSLSNAWFNILGAERSAFLRSNGIYEIDFRPQNLGGGFVARVCAHLERRGS